jgi:hypothetical protein
MVSHQSPLDMKNVRGCRDGVVKYEHSATQLAALYIPKRVPTRLYILISLDIINLAANVTNVKKLE